MAEDRTGEMGIGLVRSGGSRYLGRMAIFGAVPESLMQRAHSSFAMVELFPGEKIAFAVCLGMSATLILRLWVVHRADKFFKKLFWSLVLLLPVLGWVCYGAWYTPLARNTVYTSGRVYGDSGGPRY